MATPPITRPSLLLRIRDAADRDAWRQFVDVYAPLVYQLARRNSLQDADAADLTQDVLQAISRSARKLDYDPDRGSFRSWLFTIARNKVRNFLIRRKGRWQRDGKPGSSELLDEQPAPQETALWEQEYEQRLFDWAAGQVRGQFQDATWQAFWSTAVEGRPPGDVARTLGISVGAVYIAKSRVLARLREQIQQLEE